jgi:hypothetical protein
MSTVRFNPSTLALGFVSLSSFGTSFLGALGDVVGTIVFLLLLRQALLGIRFTGKSTGDNA